MEGLVLSCYGVRVHLAAATGTDLCHRLRETFPPAWAAPAGSGLVPVSYAVTAAPPATAGDHPRYAVSRDGSAVFGPATEEEVFRWLRRDVDRAVAERAPQMLFVQAGVVGWRGLALVIPGGGRTGKSTLVAELVRRGAAYYSDTFAVLDEAGRVHPYARPPTLGAETRPAQGLRLEGEGGPAAPLPLGLIVAGAYQPGCTWRPAIVRGARALWPLFQQTAREEVEWLMHVAGRLAPSGVTLQGAWPEASEVAAQLLDLVDDALISHASAAPGNGARRLGEDLARVAELRFRPGTGRPAPTARRLVAARYVRILDFLSPAEHRRILDQALASEEAFEDSGVTDEHGRSIRDYGFRKSRTLSGPRLEEVWDMFDARLRAILPAVRQELGVPWFPLGDIERQLTAHGSGGFFAPHVDDGHPVAASRRVSCVYYFYASPRRFTGGELKLYDTWVTPTGSTGAPTFTELAPIDNSVVFFPSDAFHEVSPVRSETEAFGDSRFAVTIWFREG
ncbi:MAG: 2OG-Fe(II) oxygenase [Chloroflexi bacterium]|nr:2OG-Fe(II) oxygenase [Chloroflexota bacterium]